LKIRWLDASEAPPLEMRSRIERRVRLVVGRRAPIIDVLAIGLTGPSFDGRVVDASTSSLHRCRIRVRLAGGGGVVVEEQAAALDGAIEAATWRLSRRLARLSARMPLASSDA